MCINAIIIGVQKGGTTSIYDWLGQHPQVDAPESIKDYHLFNAQQKAQKVETHLNYYKKNNSTIRLHSGVNYIYFYQEYAKMFREYNSNLKLIVCLRNPIERAISAFKYFKRTLRETRTFDEAISFELSNNYNSFEDKANLTYLSHGLYNEQLSGYFEVFSRDNIKIVYFEEIMNPQIRKNVLYELCIFLGIDPKFSFNFTHKNASNYPKFEFINRIVRGSYFKISDSILSPNIKRSIRRKVEQYNLSSKKIEFFLTDQQREMLSEYFYDDVKILSATLERDLLNQWDFNNKTFYKQR